MALLDPKPYPYPPSVRSTGPADWKAQDAHLRELGQKTVELPNGEIKGALIRFRVADGHAYYVVSETQPLTLQAVDFLDNYKIPPAHVRGLLEEDILAQIQYEKNLSRLFNK